MKATLPNPHKTATSALCSSLLMACGSIALAQGPAIPLPGIGPGAVSPADAVVREEIDASDRSSRFIGPDEMEEYLSSTLAGMNILKRGTDPFGQVQDPNAEPAVVKPTVTKRRPTSLKPTAFADIVGRIQINTVRPSEGVFLIGTRSFKIGDKFPIGYRGRQMQVEVVGVNSRKIDFKKVETGEVASVKLSMLPPGMKSGNQGFSAPGMVADDKNAPLNVDPISDF